MKQHFINELDSLRSQISAQGELAERSIHNAIQAFSSGDTEQARRVMVHDEIIDRDDAVDTMRSGHRTHARDLERIAGLATDICRQIIYLRTGCITRHKPD